MKNRFASLVGIGALACSALALGSAAAIAAPEMAVRGGDYTEIASEEVGGGNLLYIRCYGVNCPSVTVGSCPNNRRCCGWVNCSDPSERSVVCCTGSQTCVNGLQNDPPSSAQCVATP